MDAVWRRVLVLVFAAAGVLLVVSVFCCEKGCACVREKAIGSVTREAMAWSVPKGQRIKTQVLRALGN